MDKTNRYETKYPVHTIYNPDGSSYVQCGRYTIMDRASLEYFCNNDPVCQEWDRVDGLCDSELLPYPQLPASDPYNRPDYLTNPDGDTSWWTPAKALELYGYRPADEEPK